MSELLEKDPSDVDFFGFDYSRELPTTESLVTSTWALEAGSDGLLLVDTSSFSGKVTSFRAQGGTGGAVYLVRNTITTSIGRTLERVLRLALVDQSL
ncbi:MAG: hypothetical protein H0U56_04195 [Methylibium sp.]|nr:hypothetical protein [Methylibium sp.]